MTTDGAEPISKASTVNARGAVGAALLDASQWAGIALLLAVPMLAWRTVESQTTLQLATRWREVAIAVGVVFALRLAMVLAGSSAVSGSAAGGSVARAFKRLGGLLAAKARWLGPALVGFAAILPALPFSDRYIMDLAILVLTYVMLGWGLNVVVGLAGLLDLGYVAFYAVGAYSYALLAQHFGLSFWLCLPLAGILAAFWGILLGFPVLRLRGDYLAIVTLAFGEQARRADEVAKHNR